MFTKQDMGAWACRHLFSSPGELIKLEIDVDKPVPPRPAGYTSTSRWLQKEKISETKKPTTDSGNLQISRKFPGSIPAISKMLIFFSHQTPGMPLAQANQVFRSPRDQGRLPPIPSQICGSICWPDFSPPRCFAMFAMFCYVLLRFCYFLLCFAMFFHYLFKKNIHLLVFDMISIFFFTIFDMLSYVFPTNPFWGRGFQDLQCLQDFPFDLEVFLRVSQILCEPKNLPPCPTKGLIRKT